MHGAPESWTLVGPTARRPAPAQVGPAQTPLYCPASGACCCLAPVQGAPAMRPRILEYHYCLRADSDSACSACDAFFSAPSVCKRALARALPSAARASTCRASLSSSYFYCCRCPQPGVWCVVQQIAVAPRRLRRLDRALVALNFSALLSILTPLLRVKEVKSTSPPPALCSVFHRMRYYDTCGCASGQKLLV